MGTSGTRKYVVGDARELSEHLPEPAAVAAVDLAWARPHRNGVHVTYPTYGPEDGLWEFVDAVYESLEDGGWAFFDADDWLLPRLITYIQEEWGDVAASYRGGGYRRVGCVTYNDGGAGHYFTNAGYHVVMAHKGETDRTTSEHSNIEADRPPYSVRQEIDWGTLKPIAPYERWLDAVTTPDDLVAIPCAGSAPAALALERLYGDDARFVAVDSESGAREAYQERRRLQLASGDSGQTDLSEVTAD